MVEVGQVLPSFTAIAPFYDHLMRVVPYERWAEFALRKARNLGVDGGRALDLACGTGNFSVLLVKAGFEVLGVDLSEHMVREAKKKAPEVDGGLDFVVGDVRALPLRGRLFDLVTCVYDSLNYLLTLEGLWACFREVGRALRRGGVFIFDLNTELALAGGFFDQNNFGADDWLHFEWRSRYDRRSRICTVTMKFWVNTEGSIKEFVEVHNQRAHSEGEVEEGLRLAGLKVVGVFDDYTEREANIFTDRAVWVAVKE